MLRGLLVAALVAAALARLPAAAYADDADPIVYLSFDDGWVYPPGVRRDVRIRLRLADVGDRLLRGQPALRLQARHLPAGPHTVSVTATDYEGRQTTKSDYACEDDPGGLGLYEGYCAGTIPVGAQIDTSQIGTFSLTVTTVDLERGSP
jgi:hypothetical protein